ncbi:imidazolonepropionase [Kordia periserrulae]|uniref:Imidazolonepropionase n=1 Tax=Kordia periserrulae TaxID=701523 RepID=A0A2T6C3G5_9FLAO|nr:imidazolonepropionase [Kordia periserrulae]PTX62844.1 imidazolonepropionase [Kordia periserrulae]
MTTLLINIKQLLQVRETNVSKVSGADMKQLPMLENAYVYLVDDKIASFGLMADIEIASADTIIDCTNKVVLPTWCDSHTHLVYAGNRAQEFVDRINGLSYEEIANRGGGILNSAKKLQETSEDALFEQSATRLENVMHMGIGAIEIKSGYGLTTEAELKMLRVAKRLKEIYNFPIKTTFLGAHAVPANFKENQDGYMDLVINEMLPKVAEENLAEYVDIFCEKGYFTLEDTERLLQAAQQYKLIPKIHVNQFNAFGGVALGVQYNALSVDHLEELNDEDIQALQGSNTMPVALPSCSYFLSIPYTPARKIIDAGLPIALATDYNPGSTPSGNMNFVVSTACIKMKMTPEEAINAATINGAYAMGLSETHGSITQGKAANLIITKEIESFHVLPYAFGDNCIDKVLINGSVI